MAVLNGAAALACRFRFDALCAGDLVVVRTGSGGVHDMIQYVVCILLVHRSYGKFILGKSRTAWYAFGSTIVFLCNGFKYRILFSFSSQR
jgi:hypothetical protein